MIDLEDRFWSKVNKTEDCWLWTGWASKTRDGRKRGRIRIDGRWAIAARVSWYLTYGYYPKQVNHRECNNSLCVNPSHLYDGTQSQNIQDSIRRGTAKSHGKLIDPITKKLTKAAG